MRPRAINVGRYAPLPSSGFFRTRQRGLPLRTAWVERLSESHQFRIGDRVLFCPGEWTCPSVALPIVGMRRTTERPEYQVRCRDGYTVWLPESLLQRVTR